MNVKHRVTLDTSERVQLVAMVLGGKGAFRRLKRAQILIATDNGATDEEIARNVAVGTSTVYRTKQRFVEEGLERADTRGVDDAMTTRSPRDDVGANVTGLNDSPPRPIAGPNSSAYGTSGRSRTRSVGVVAIVCRS
jgi:hypothetical protein